MIWCFLLTKSISRRLSQNLAPGSRIHFAAKMMQLNGVGVEVGADCFSLHPFYDTSDKKRTKRTCNIIVHETKMARVHYRLPNNLIVIGNNCSGDVLVYKVEGNGSIDPTVYWFDHETEEMVFAANEFSDLKESL